MTQHTRVHVAPALLAALTCALAGCASRSASPTTGRSGVAAAHEARDDSADYPLIVRLVGRHYTVTASSGPHGVVYSAEGADGRMIVANASLDEMRLRHPEIYQQILPGVATQGEAQNTRRRDTAEDASIEGPIPMGQTSQPANGMGPRGDMLLHSARW